MLYIFEDGALTQARRRETPWRDLRADLVEIAVDPDAAIEGGFDKVGGLPSIGDYEWPRHEDIPMVHALTIAFEDYNCVVFYAPASADAWHVDAAPITCLHVDGASAKSGPTTAPADVDVLPEVRLVRRPLDPALPRVELAGRSFIGPRLAFRTPGQSREFVRSDRPALVQLASELLPGAPTGTFYVRDTDQKVGYGCWQGASGPPKRAVAIENELPPRTTSTTIAQAALVIGKILTAPPTRGRWLQLWDELEAGANEDRAACIETLLPLVEARLDEWPPKIRMAPLPFILDLIEDRLPAEFLRITSGLSLAAACFGSANDCPRFAALRSWVEALGPGVPAQRGLHLGLRRRDRRRIEAACSRASCDGEVPAFDVDGHHYDAGFVQALLQSPLAREVEVVDLSLDVPDDDLIDGTQDTLNGRFADVQGVARGLTAPDRLVALDLHGHYTQPGSFARTCRDAIELPNLRALNLGGGHPWVTADIDALRRNLIAPTLQHLNLAPNETGEVDSDSFQDEEMELALRSYWNIHDGTPLATSAGSLSKLVESAPALRTLILSKPLQTDPETAGIANMRDDLEVEFRWHLHSDNPFAGDWTEFFEL